MSKSLHQQQVEQDIARFDPGGVGALNGRLFGFPHDYGYASTVVIGVPWDVTTSYHEGTCGGPSAILQASPQLDFYDLDYPDAWRRGIYMVPLPGWLLARNRRLRRDAIALIRQAEQGLPRSPVLEVKLGRVNQGCRAMEAWVCNHTRAALTLGKHPIIIGGDHSVPLGGLQALAERYDSFGILHLDAHGDLRCAYEGFDSSHASIMYNVLQLPQVTRLVQVGIRDISHGEMALVKESEGRVVPHFDSQLRQAGFSGKPWLHQCQEIVEALPQRVYISCDVDGLDPKLCPNTGTPVPGGLNLEELFCLWRTVVASGRQIIGGDLCETGHHEWDGSVSARILYKLFSLMELSQQAA